MGKMLERPFCASLKRLSCQRLERPLFRALWAKRMVCLLLSHLELHTPGASSSDVNALYADAIGAVISTSKADTSSTTQINIGVSQLKLRSLHLESHALAGHVELWTREPLDAVASRVSAIVGEDETTLVAAGPAAWSLIVLLATG